VAHLLGLEKKNETKSDSLFVSCLLLLSLVSKCWSNRSQFALLLLPHSMCKQSQEIDLRGVRSLTILHHFSLWRNRYRGPFCPHQPRISGCENRAVACHSFPNCPAWRTGFATAPQSAQPPGASGAGVSGT